MNYNNPRDVIKKDDGLLAYYCAGQLANLFARLALKVKFLTPNFYTTLSLLFALGTIYLFASTNHELQLWGCITLLFTLIFDCADGQTARLKGMMSKFGHWYDYHTDKIKDIALLLALSYSVYMVSNNYWVFIFAFLAIAFQFLRNITRLNRINFELEQGEEVKNPTLIKKNNNQFLTSLKNTTMFKEADRYSLFIIGILFNQIGIAIFIYMLLEAFFATSSAYLNYKKFKKYDEKYPTG